MSNKDAEKEEMKDETHEVEDTEQAEQDADNEIDEDYQQEWILLKLNYLSIASMDGFLLSSLDYFKWSSIDINHYISDVSNRKVVCSSSGQDVELLLHE